MKKHYKSSLIIITLALLSSCGGSSSGGGSNPVAKPESRKPVERQEEIIENQPTVGSYRAFIRPMNTRVFGRLNSGLASVDVTENEFKLNLYMDDTSQVGHMQAIYTGSRCPTLSDDQNKDGFIDIQEAMKVSGKMLIPLDEDLTSQVAGEKIFPKGMAYEYKKNIELSTMLKDLKDRDSDVRDELVKLKANEELNLDGRIILVHGVANKNQLPTSVASLQSMTSYETIPVSCGVIRRVAQEEISSN